MRVPVATTTDVLCFLCYEKLSPATFMAAACMVLHMASINAPQLLEIYFCYFANARSVGDS